MKDTNQVTLVGYVGGSNVYNSQFGPIVNFTLATRRSWKGKSGNWEEETTWHNCKVMNKLADRLLPHIQKGNRLMVEGRLEEETWADKQTGEQRSKTVIRAMNIELVQPVKAQQNGQQQNGYQQGYPQNGYQQPPQQRQQQTGGYQQNYGAPQHQNSWPGPQHEPPVTDRTNQYEEPPF